MSTSKQSLRWVVEKWFGSNLSASIRLTRAKESWRKPCRCVRVEAVFGSDPFSILFFRHDDGSWYVFPPEERRLEIGVARAPALMIA